MCDSLVANLLLSVRCDITILQLLIENIKGFICGVQMRCNFGKPINLHKKRNFMFFLVKELV